MSEPFARRVASIEADYSGYGGSIVKLDCGHLFWCALAPAEIGTLKTVYCTDCLCKCLEKRPADAHAN